MNFDPVQRPSHYNKKGRETIDVLRDIAEKFDDPWVACLVYQASKYLMRFEFKNGEQDLEKCIWYIKELASYRYPNCDLAKEHRRDNRPTSDEYQEQQMLDAAEYAPAPEAIATGYLRVAPGHCDVHGPDSYCNCKLLKDDPIEFSKAGGALRDARLNAERAHRAGEAQNCDCAELSKGTSRTLSCNRCEERPPGFSDRISAVEDRPDHEHRQTSPFPLYRKTDQKLD